MSTERNTSGTFVLLFSLYLHSRVFLRIMLMTREYEVYFSTLFATHTQTHSFIRILSADLKFRNDFKSIVLHYYI
jgi:hypothetical protein